MLVADRVELARGEPARYRIPALPQGPEPSEPGDRAGQDEPPEDGDGDAAAHGASSTADGLVDYCFEVGDEPFSGQCVLDPHPLGLPGTCVYLGDDEALRFTGYHCDQLAEQSTGTTVAN